MTAEEAKQDIARRAGVKSGKVTVYFWPVPMQPPTLQWYTHGKDVVTQRSRRSRRVVVGRAWLQEHAPTAWAAFMAARLIGDWNMTRHIPTDAPRPNN